MGNHTTVSTFLLWGFSSFPDLQTLLFVTILFSHATILAANASVMVAIKCTHNLHTPLNCFIMSAMSYDRYTAIRNPLHYATLMTPKVCFQLMTASWVLGFLVSLCIVVIIFNLSFCDSNVIQHFFCDISPVMCLACDYTLYHEMAVFVFSAFVLGGSFILIMISYIFIGSVVMKVPSAKGRCKAFSTCSSHLTVVCIHYAFAGFVYLRPKDRDSVREDMLMAVAYTILTPLLNPIVYSLRNKEMQRPSVLSAARGHALSKRAAAWAHWGHRTVSITAGDREGQSVQFWVQDTKLSVSTETCHILYYQLFIRTVRTVRVPPPSPHLDDPII
ncbi:olfactory receptor 10Z1-like [Sus scrofa]|uniref:olfactory receptor 10Z1-like n=1 Tax=Sus scrofa TaxID=9823 RepID=UPI000A2AF1E7|nr:olfactory receptor 10Z1-like [Sus scrofa]